MTNKHTPGPWTTYESKRGFSIEAPGSSPSSRVTVCEIHETAIRKDQEDRAEHDAHLIARAPELLEALEYILHQAGLDPQSPSYKTARDAIAKAKGAK